MNYFDQHRKSAWHCFLIVLGCWMFTMAWSPAASAQTCVSENLDTLIATTPTCGIGTIQFTFYGLEAVNYSYDASTFTQTNGTTYTASDFTFSPVSNGFSLTFDGPPQSITAPANGYAYDYLYLLYSAADTNETFVGESATGGTLTATGNTNSSSEIYGDLCGPSCGSVVFGYYYAEEYLGQQAGSADEDAISGSPFSDGQESHAYPFLLYAENGDSATWDGTPTTFTFDTVSATPEPTSLLLFATGLLGIILVNRKKLFA